MSISWKTVKNYSALLIFFGNLFFLGWFVHQYAGEWLAPIVGVNIFCAGAQKLGIGLAISHLAWVTKGKLGNLHHLAAFEMKKNPLFFLGFMINRLGSIIPPIYALIVTWGKLPFFIVIYLVLDGIVALWAAHNSEQWIQNVGGFFAEKNKQAAS